MNKSQIAEIRILSELGDHHLALITFHKKAKQPCLKTRNREFLKRAAILTGPAPTSTDLYF